MQSVEKPMVALLSSGPRGRENALVRIALGAVRKESDDRLAGSQPLGDAQCRRRRGSGRSADREAFLAGDLPAGVEGFLVADLQNLVDERAVEDRPDPREPDAFDLVRSGRSSAEDRPL